jgi:hypothetical protein
VTLRADRRTAYNHEAEFRKSVLMALSEDYHKQVMGRKAKGENQAGLAYKLITSFSTAVEQVGALDIVPCSTICISKSERVIIDMLATYFRGIERCFIIVFNLWTP